MNELCFHYISSILHSIQVIVHGSNRFIIELIVIISNGIFSYGI